MYTTVIEAIRTRLTGEGGNSMVEYALLLMFITVAALIALAAFGQNLSSNLSTTVSSMG